jgi:hypothetical protein
MTHTLSLTHTHTNKVLTTLSPTIPSTYQHDKGAHLDKDGEEGTEALDKAYRYTLYGCHLCVCVCVLYGTHTHILSTYVCVRVCTYVCMYVCICGIDDVICGIDDVICGIEQAAA